MKAYLDGQVIKLQFRYDPKVIDFVRNLPNRVWDKETKIWSIPYEDGLKALPDLIRWGFAIDPAITEARDSQKLTAEAEYESQKPIIMELGDLVLKSHEMGLIDQATQGRMLDLINHISLKDFIR